MYDKDGSGCIDKTELKEIVEVITSCPLIISYSDRARHGFQLQKPFKTVR